MCVLARVRVAGEGGYVRADNDDFVLHIIIIIIITTRGRQRRGGQSREGVDLRGVDAGVALVAGVLNKDGHGVYGQVNRSAGLRGGGICSSFAGAVRVLLLTGGRVGFYFCVFICFFVITYETA